MPTVAPLILTTLLTLLPDTNGLATNASENQRLDAHFSQVLTALENAPVDHLTDSQRLRRQKVIQELTHYAIAREFPHNLTFPDQRPIFVDDDGRRCAVAHLLEATGEAPLMNEIARDANLAFIGDLADDRRLQSWLEKWGLSLDEAAKIQPSYPSREEPMAAWICSIFACIGEQQDDSVAGPSAFALVSATVQSVDPSLEIAGYYFVSFRIDDVFNVQPAWAQESFLSSELVVWETSDFRTLSIGEQRTLLFSFNRDEPGPQIFRMLPTGNAWDYASLAGAWWLPQDPPAEILPDLAIKALSQNNGWACMATLSAQGERQMCAAHSIRLPLGHACLPPFPAEDVPCACFEERSQYTGPAEDFVCPAPTTEAQKEEKPVPSASGNGCPNGPGVLSLAPFLFLARNRSRRRRR